MSINDKNTAKDMQKNKLTTNFEFHFYKSQVKEASINGYGGCAGGPSVLVSLLDPAVASLSPEPISHSSTSLLRSKMLSS
jgi:hypothetical protein